MDEVNRRGLIKLESRLGAGCIIWGRKVYFERLEVQVTRYLILLVYRYILSTNIAGPHELYEIAEGCAFALTSFRSASQRSGMLRARAGRCSCNFM